MAEDRGGEVIKGTLEMIVLEILQQGAMHGWGITELIERRSDRLLSVKPGLALPDAVPPRRARMDFVRVGHLREQPSSTLLHHHARRPQAARR